MDAGEAMAALNGMELYYYVLVRRWLALYWMYGGGSLIWDAGVAVAALNGMELYYYVREEVAALNGIWGIAKYYVLVRMWSGWLLYNGMELYYG